MGRDRSRSFVITPSEVPYFTVPARRHFKRFSSGAINKAPSIQDAKDAMQDCVMSFQNRTKCLSLGIPTSKRSPRSSPTRTGFLGTRSMSTSIRTTQPPPQNSLLSTRSMTMYGPGRSNRSLCNTAITISPSKQRLPTEQRFSSMGNIHPMTQRHRDVLPEVPVLFDSWLPNLLPANRSPRRHKSSSSSRGSPRRAMGVAGSHSTLCPTKLEQANKKYSVYRERCFSDSRALECRRLRPVSPSMSTNHEDPSRSSQDSVAPTPGPKDSINVSLNFKAHEKQLEVGIHGLTCQVPAGGTAGRSSSNSPLVVELTLNPGKQRHLLRDVPPLTGDSDGSIFPPKTVVFKGVKSAGLSSKILSINVYTKALLRRTGRLLYQTCMPLADVALYGDANWVSFESSTAEKVKKSISVCLCFNAHRKRLMITVVNAKALKRSALRKDSYVEVKLFRRDGAENEAMKTVRTKCHQGGSNPVYKEAFSFDFTTEGSDASRYAELTFTVRRKGFFGADKVLGEVTLSSELQLRWKKSESLKNTLDEVFRYPGKVITQSHNLSPCSYN